MCCIDILIRMFVAGGKELVTYFSAGGLRKGGSAATDVETVPPDGNARPSGGSSVGGRSLYDQLQSQRASGEDTSVRPGTGPGGHHIGLKPARLDEEDAAFLESHLSGARQRELDALSQAEIDRAAFELAVAATRAADGGAGAAARRGLALYTAARSLPKRPPQQHAVDDDTEPAKRARLEEAGGGLANESASIAVVAPADSVSSGPPSTTARNPEALEAHAIPPQRRPPPPPFRGAAAPASVNAPASHNSAARASDVHAGVSASGEQRGSAAEPLGGLVEYDSGTSDAEG